MADQLDEQAEQNAQAELNTEELNADRVNETDTISLELSYVPKVNFAVQQNLVPIFHTLNVVNDTDRALNNIRIVVQTSPEFLQPSEIFIDHIEPRSEATVEKFDEKLFYSVLADLSERVRGEIKLELYSQDAGMPERSVVEQTFPVDLLAYDEWQGCDTNPSLLAAFVTPNLDSVSKLLTAVGDRLKAQGKSPSLDGYQAQDPGRVYEVVQTIFEVVRSQGVRYLNPPASFESEGQRVRFVDAILSDKLGACLDMSLLFASVLEAAGLNPIIALQRGHAYVGCHLKPEAFSESFTDDLQALRKRAEVNYLLVFESTLALDGNNASFVDAVNTARKNLHIADEYFHGTLDVKRARLEKIRPLPLRRGAENSGEPSIVLDLESAATYDDSHASRDIMPYDVRVDDEPTTPKTRIDRWKQKLLDLSQRNRFLNYREDKKTLHFVLPEDLLASLEDKLYDGKAFSICPLVADENDKRVRATTDLRETAKQYDEKLRYNFERQTLNCRLGIDRDEMNKRLKDISKQAQKFLQESGSNALYLTLGKIERPDAKDKTVKRFAPLLLIPVRVSGNPNKDGYSLLRSDEDAMINVTLFELMRRDYGKEIRGLDPNDLPTDDHGLDVEKIFKIVQQELIGLTGWELHKEISISLFSFQKFVMWSDLNDHIDEISSAPVVRHLVETPDRAYVDGVKQVQSNELDASYPYSKIVTPLSADSSQLAATIAAEKGKSFILQGPPGTGKSQTITNIIAHCLYNGKKTLFVAEKRAALEVVYSRLCNLGLGPFCLELHSNKSGKQQILDQLQEALNVVEEAQPQSWQETTDKLEELKRELNDYVNALHTPYVNGLSLYDALSWLEARVELNDVVPEFTANCSLLTIQKAPFEAYIRLGSDLQNAAGTIPCDAWAKLAPFGVFKWSPKFVEGVCNSAQALIATNDMARSSFNAFASRLGAGKNDDRDELERVYKLVDVLVESRLDLPAGAYDAQWAQNLPKYRRVIELARRLDANYANLQTAGVGLAIADPFAKYAHLEFDAHNDALSPEINGSSELFTQAKNAYNVFERFYLATHNLFTRLGIGRNKSGRAIAKVGAVVEALAEHKTPAKQLLQEDWKEFSANARQLLRSLQDIEKHRLATGPYDLNDVDELTFDSDNASTLPNRAFEFAKKYADVAATENASSLASSLNDAVAALNELLPAAATALSTLELQDAPTEDVIVSYLPLFQHLAKLPPKSVKLFSADWSNVAPKLRQGIAAAKRYADLKRQYAEYDLDVLNSDVLHNAYNIAVLPQGMYALRNIRNASNVNIANLSLAELQKESQDSAQPFLDDYVDLLDRLFVDTEEILRYLNVDPFANEAKTTTLFDVFNVFGSAVYPSDAFFNSPWEESSAILRETLELLKRENELKLNLREYDVEKLVSYDVAAARVKHDKAASAFFLFRSSKKKALLNELRATTLNGAPSLTFESVPQLLNSVDALQKLREETRSRQDRIGALLANPLRVGALSCDMLERYLALGQKLYDCAKRLDSSFDVSRVWRGIGALWAKRADGNSNENRICEKFEHGVERYRQQTPTFIGNALKVADECVKFKAEHEYNRELCEQRFAEEWNDLESDWARLESYLETGDALANDVNAIVSNSYRVGEFMRWIGSKWTRENYENGWGKALNDFNAAWERYVGAYQALSPLYSTWKRDLSQARKFVDAHQAETLRRFDLQSFDGYDIEPDLDAGDEIVQRVDELHLTGENLNIFLNTIANAWYDLNDADSNTSKLVKEFIDARAEFDAVLPPLWETIKRYPFKTSVDAFPVDAQPEKLDLAALTSALTEYAAVKEELDATLAELAERADFIQKGDKLAPNAAEKTLEKLVKLDSIVVSDQERDTLGALFANVATPDRYSDLFQDRIAVREQYDQLKSEVAALETTTAHSRQHSPLNAVNVFDAAKAFADVVLDQSDNFGAWQNWLEIAKKAQPIYPRFVDAIASNTLRTELIAQGVQYRLYEEFANAVVGSSQLLQKVVSDIELQDRNIARFNKLDAKYAELARRLTLYELAKKLPSLRNAENLSKNTELGLLKHELKLKKHARSIRQILGSIPSLLRTLKPCLLTSPLSVAQYLPPNGEKFDVVVFDEASQIPVWDAIGAIARGAQVIIVGDSKQLPPTNFFQRATDDDNDEVEIADAESILDECGGAGLPEVMLKWHYRSRHEALIAFSNDRYYDGRLKTFPSSDRSTTGVRFEFVQDGVYDRGNTATNKNEARKLVADVVKKLRDPSFADKSLGVVTFNEAQKDVIEDMLDEERQKHPEIEPFFAPDRREPVFVKNLENVQGDERDVIYFSICYGPTPSGKLSHNFGPLNKVGGERRLNVAITRAKEENVVFSSFHAADIDLSRLSGSSGVVKSRGVYDLKLFLEFAERGGERIVSQQSSAAQDSAGVVESVAEFLRENGYDVRTRVGFSNARVDVAIVDPNNAKRYIVGVECDGTTYRDSETTRDRVVLRKQILEGLGWQILRVWSPAWRFSPAKARQKLLDEVAKAIEQDATAAANTTPAPATPEVEEEPLPPEPKEVVEPQRFAQNVAPPKPSKPSVEQVYPSLAYLDSQRWSNAYVPQAQRMSMLTDQVDLIVATEGPILEKVLEKRVKGLLNISRTSSDFRLVFGLAIKNAHVKHTVEQDGQLVYWAQDVDPNTYAGFRAPCPNEPKREFQEIPLCEIINAGKKIVQEYGHVSDPEFLLRLIVQKFGFTRITTQMKDRISQK